jgi:hypothetical protein
MKTLGTMMMLLAISAHAGGTLTVHEWGTFTSVSGSDGALLPGLEVEEESLPNFVHSFAEFSPAMKGLNHPVRNVTVKMETPVLYFYATKPLTAQVEVGFHGGSISQWYPDRVAGETLPASVDFSGGYNGSATWRVDVLAKDTTEKITAPTKDETAQWPRARVAAANRLRGPKGEVEDFIFYRGVGNFSLPLRVTAGEDGALTIQNTGGAVIPYVLVYLKQTGQDPLTRELFNLAPGKTWVPSRPGIFKTRFHGALEEAGLSYAEAAALLATWKESYFDRPGLRVFWIVPRAFTDCILPLAITPAPDKLERVLVGRSEVLTPAFEKELADGFRADGGTRWSRDRYFLAYRERARQLGVVLPENAP